MYNNNGYWQGNGPTMAWASSPWQNQKFYRMPAPVQQKSPIDEMLANRKPYQYQPLLNVMGNFAMPAGLLDTAYAGEYGAGRFMNGGNAMMGAPMQALQQSIASKATK